MFKKLVMLLAVMAAMAVHPSHKVHAGGPAYFPYAITNTGQTLISSKLCETFSFLPSTVVGSNSNNVVTMQFFDSATLAGATGNPVASVALTVNAQTYTPMAFDYCFKNGLVVNCVNVAGGVTMTGTVSLWQYPGCQSGQH